MTVQLVPAKPTDAFALKLRPEDAREVPRGWERGVYHAILRYGATAAVDEEGLVAIFGITEDDESLSPWLLCSERVSLYRRNVVVEARRFVRRLEQEAKRRGKAVWNYIPVDSDGNRAFVAALGFAFQPSAHLGWDIFYLPSCASIQSP